jgi:integrase/recombinase XerD
MTHPTLLGPWVRRFLLAHLVGERNLARHTQRSDRDVLVLLLPFIADFVHQSVDQLQIDDITAEHVRLFLHDVEQRRHCSVTTRNQRLAAIHALARFIGQRSPEHIAWGGQLRTIPFKKTAQTPITSLEKAAMDALLGALDRRTAQGRRDYGLLLFLSNTGARADEAAQLRLRDLRLGQVPQREPSSVELWGKGNKRRPCPLWPHTASELTTRIEGREPTEHVFLNRCGRPITRFGIHTLVERYARRVAVPMPRLANKRVSPHTIRHTTATHLLCAGVDINTIRAWLGHVSLNTTNIYAETDLEMKAKALAQCEVMEPHATAPWREDKSLRTFLQSL